MHGTGLEACLVIIMTLKLSVISCTGLKTSQQCKFTNADEVVKFLFLIHNKHSEVKQELLKCVTKDTTLGQFLEYACNIGGNLQSVKLSKYVEKVQPSVSATEVHVVDKRKVKPK